MCEYVINMIGEEGVFWVVCILVGLEYEMVDY